MSLRVGAVVVAAGAGTRFGAETPKQFLTLAGAPVAAHSVRAFQSLAEVREIVAVLPADGFDCWKGVAAPFLEGARLVPGGATRQESVGLGVAALDGPFDLIAVHDAARPGADPDLIRRVFAAAAESGAALPALRPPDTLWSADGDEAHAVVDRDRVRAAQTPQCFVPEVLSEAMDRARRDGFSGSDEATLVRRAGRPVRLVEGSARNLKVTRPEDLDMIRRVFAGKERPSRVGSGWDVHRFADAAGPRPLMLGGAAFPGEPPLVGHSDGDALLHAVTDAILGAVAAGDIGGLFPSSDEALRGAASERFVRRALEVALEAGYRPGQADLTVIANRPRLAPRAAEIRERIAALLGIPLDAVGLKATTTDGLGFAGRGEGLAAQALVRMDPA